MAYTIIGWLLIQVMELAAESFEAPVWVMKMLITIVMLGFLPVLLFSWAYEITPEGIKHERDVIRDESIAHLTARKLDYLTLVAALSVVVLIVWQTFGATTATPAIDTTRDATGTARLGSHSIAVLPFANRSNSDDDLFFTDGIHDDLLTQLSKISDLKVTSRTSVMEYRNTTKKVAQIAAELGVATVLEGSVQRAGHRIRINAQLIEVETDTHLWAETFDREMTIENLFDIQSEITRQIATAVKGHLTPEESSSSATAPTQNIAAYEAYLRARDVLKGDYTVEQYMTAQPMVEKAIVLDPEFALAYLLLAEIHGQAAWIGYDDTTQRRQAAYMALNKADGLLGPQSPELLAARGEYLYRFEQDYPAALKVQIKALAAMPGNALILEQIGLTQRRLGMWEESVDSFLRGAELDPANVSLVSLTADTLLAMQQWSRMKSVLTPARERFADDVDLAATEVLLSLRSEGDVKTARQQFNKIPPNSGEIYFLIATELPWFERDITAVINAWNQPEVVRYAANSGWAGFRELMLAMAYLHLQKSEQAGQLLDEVIRSLMDLDRERRSSTVAADLGTLALAMALRGETTEAIQLAEEAARIESRESDSLSGVVPLQYLCQVLALSGERDRALELLAEIVGVPGGLTRWEMYLDPRWDFFRDDERFNDLIRPHNLDR
ncbi:MAG: hypothetical protein IIB77_01075 [Proteobacteria bacterium]|nr:hypothetical protein [Pseudomonadota bacterium]